MALLLGQRFLRRLLARADVDARGDHLLLNTVEHRVGYDLAVQADRSNRVVVAGDHVADGIGIGVAVDHGHHGNVQLVRLGDRDGLLVGVENEQQVGQPAHVLDAAERALKLVAQAGAPQQFLFGQAAGLLLLKLLLEGAQTPDRDRDRLPVRQRSAEPTLVDVELSAALGGRGDGLGRLPLGPDEQHPAAAGDDVAHLDERAMEQRHGLLQVDDMGVVANAEQVRSHFRVPTTGRVTEVDAGFEKLTHGKLGQGHRRRYLFRLIRRECRPRIPVRRKRRISQRRGERNPSPPNYRPRAWVGELVAAWPRPCKQKRRVTAVTPRAPRRRRAALEWRGKPTATPRSRPAAPPRPRGRRARPPA